ncbi:hypothetical protein AK812_SmicGene4221 [Symbiodinium microadriaticum]|uniref:Uncharacterized protein n=1 Tax=Symbiodinium microadriaticum TaxID=2951 RepID=A0A1Q9EWQ6_SYMMI|nr:hypothetical protein AK812_SmicGene4221 [Symbiodinium microadriaticum]
MPSCPEMDAKVKELEVKVEEANSGIAEAAKLGAVHFVQQAKGALPGNSLLVAETADVVVVFSCEKVFTDL